ncbi:MAG: hypothetical protein U0L16_09405, partial [Phocaeicola sp.]|nr:hypothetical protein [Phocaeicola sp.]
SREYIEQQPWFTRAMENSGRFVITPTNVARESEDEYLPTDTFYVSRRINNIRLPCWKKPSASFPNFRA